MTDQKTLCAECASLLSSGLAGETLLKVLSDAVVAMAEDGWLYCGPEGLDEAQEKCLKAYRMIKPANILN